jgi:GLPGLI family protein
MNLKVGIKLFLIGVLLFLISPVFSQYATSGKIIFERRTNLEKRFTDKRMKRMINETNKIKTDKFVLLFNDTCSIFKLVVENTGADDMAWMTTKNTYYQQLQKKSQLTILGLFGQSVYVLDSLPSRKWKITDNKRVISGYDGILQRLFRVLGQKDFVVCLVQF